MEAKPEPERPRTSTDGGAYSRVAISGRCQLKGGKFAFGVGTNEKHRRAKRERTMNRFFPKKIGATYAEVVVSIR